MAGDAIGTMRAVVHDRFGEPGQVLRLDRSLPVLAPDPDEVLVRISFSPVHPGDIAIVAGGGDGSRLPQPRVPGFEGAGVVEATGSEVSDVEPGQRVAVFLFPTPGAWAEYLTVKATSVFPLPEEIDDTVASMLLINPLTARMLVRAVEDAWSGSPRTFIQTAAGSSVGQFIAAVAEQEDYQLVNVVRSEEGATRLTKRFPSLSTLTTSDPQWPDHLRDLLNGPASVVLDAVGGTLANELLDVLEDGGTIISYGALAGSSAPLNDGALLERNLQPRTVSVGRWDQLSAEQRAADLAFALDLALTRRDLFEVADVFDLAEFAAAIEEVGRPGRIGTVLLTNPPE